MPLKSHLSSFHLNKEKKNRRKKAPPTKTVVKSL